MIDYVISDQNLYRKIKNCKTWRDEARIVSDHRVLTIEIEGSLEKKGGRGQRQTGKREEGKRSWRREIRDRENFERTCEREMKRWGEECGGDKAVSSEQAWRTWLDTHNKIAEETVGRHKKRKEREWLKREWDQEVFEAVREENRWRKEMGRVRGEERKGVGEEDKKTREKVKKILRKKEKRRQQEKNEKLENFRGRNEREYWKYLKNLIGIKKKEERLPEEVQIGDRVERVRRERRFGTKRLAS